MDALREETFQTYSDLHKDARGYRPRHGADHLSIEEMERELDQFADEINQNMQHDAVRNKECEIEFEAFLSDTMDRCSCDRAKAITYLMDAEGLDPKDFHTPGALRFSYGLSYDYKL